ncbi:hypothetical protein N7478_008178 [Penicillium angulare]|uniref:uncharacterized protein n=1 Tax=Penicillium angulare TaxID=116970 RepID=UPI002540626A|nr:uncharacterized protein N7478_008178 [Penicillium angulare]KAJ5273053.1 hypothetical protein N7478_008178 [Penicillium angulare]
MSNPPFTVRAVFEYASGHDDDLSFPIGQVITVTEEEDAEWYCGAYTDGSGAKQEGIFPKNFVEKYDPPAPPRPTRPTRPKKESEPAPPPVEPTPVVESPIQPEPEVTAPPAEEEPEPVPQQPPTPQSPLLASSPTASAIPSSPPQPAPVSAPAPAPAAPAPPPTKASTKPPPPAVADKPSGNSFKDRIAAFNKSAAPVAPIKPGGQQSSSFVKKQFVAPPPSKDFYVAPPSQPATKIYKREEDPEVQEQLSREPPVSETRAPPPALPVQESEEGAEDQPKPTSLKDRIALLQKQQLEQAQRHADAAQKKEKPKPPKKTVERPVEPAPVDEERDELLEASPIEPPSAPRDPSVDTLRGKAPPVQPPPFSPQEEIASESNDADYSAAADSEDAGETSTSRDDEDERPRQPPAPPARTVEQKNELEDSEEEEREQEGKDEEEEGEEEEEMDPEVRHKMELRARMAKMSGGMGMMGLFGPGGGLPGMGGPPPARKPKTPGESEKKLAEPEPSSPTGAPPVQMIPLPGMNLNTKPAPPTNVEKEEEEPETTPVSEQHAPQEVPDVEEVVHEAPPRSSTDRAPPVPPSRERAVPAPPLETRPVPQRVPTDLGSPPPVPGGRPVPPPPRPPVVDQGDESDDELSVHAKDLSLDSKDVEAPAPAIPDHLDSRRSSTYETPPPAPPASNAERRASRAPPPVPSNPPVPPAQSRAPPPPPPNQPRRRSTADSRTSALSAPRQAGEEAEGEVTEYDGDYDTDIASGATHKDALRAHERDSSFDEGTITDDYSLQSPRSPPASRGPPPLPPTAAPRAVPPLPPSQPPHRPSIDTPRGPPPPPPGREPPRDDNGDDDEEYDPFNYADPRHGLYSPPAPPSGRPEVPPPMPPQSANERYDDLYDESPVQSPSNEAPPPVPKHEKRASLAPMPPQSQAPPMPSPSASRSGRPSMDMMRGSSNLRRSMDVSRPSIDQGYIATDVDFAESTLWWTQPNTVPPSLQNRPDVLYETEESSSTKRGGKTTISKDIYILFIDYSQTVIAVQFDSKNPADVSLEQRQESPPLQPRQDQLEQAHNQIGTRIAESVTSFQNSTVGDGTPLALVQHLLNPLSDALLPVGSRAYGALVYSNLANASVSQNDEIRAGDIVSFRNARFQGHRGTMHQKYSAEVGKPDHVGVVVDWDGTKKKIRAWEQGRESKKVKMESFKLNDMRSGECKVWRVMPRSWVGWESNK